MEILVFLVLLLSFGDFQGDNSIIINESICRGEHPRRLGHYQTKSSFSLTGLSTTDGDLQWMQTYGGMEADWADAVIETADGGFVLVGRTVFRDVISEPVIWLIKTDANGTMQWNRHYGNGSVVGIRGGPNTSVIQTDDRGYAFVGAIRIEATVKLWLVKTDSKGISQWNQTYGEEMFYRARVIQTEDGGFALAGSTSSNKVDHYNAWLVKTDARGVIQWERTYVYPGHDKVWAMIQTADGGFALVGDHFIENLPNGGVSSEPWLVKTDAHGMFQWKRTYESGMLYSVIETEEGGFALFGQTGIGFLIKTDATGHVEWNQTYGSDAPLSGIQTKDGGFAMTGILWGPTKAWLAKINATGHLEWYQTYGEYTNIQSYSVIQTRDGGLALAGVSEESISIEEYPYSLTHHDFLLVRIKPLDTIVPEFIMRPKDIIYEDGTTGHNLTWIVEDRYPGTYEILLNNFLWADSLSWTNGTVIWNVDGLAPSIYNLTLVIQDSYNNRVVDTVWVTVTGEPDMIPPKLSAPTDLAYEEGMSDQVISWEIGDWHPGTYLIFNNSVIVSGGFWTNGTLTWNVSDLATNFYNITIVVWDMANNNVSDTVWVTVTASASPELSSPENIIYKEGTTGHIISWVAEDRYPGTYEIYIDSEQVDSGSWTNGTLNWNVDELSAGTYNVTLVLQDLSGKRVTDTVEVTVLPETALPEFSTLRITEFLILMILLLFRIKKKEDRIRE